MMEKMRLGPCTITVTLHSHCCLPIPLYPDSRVKEIVLDMPVHMIYMGLQPAPLLHTWLSAV